MLESAGAEHRLIKDEDLRRLSAERCLLLIHVNSKDPQMCRVWFSPFWVDSWELYSSDADDTVKAIGYSQFFS